jgi:2-aminoadipate transaminase
MATVDLSIRARQTEDQPISYFMKAAVEHPNLISLAAGLVDQESLPTEDAKAAFDEILADPALGRAALQYGTTEGYAPLRDKILAHHLGLEGQTRAESGLSASDVVVSTGSQQLLYLIGEMLLDPGDIVIAEAPSYFVYHGTLASLGVRVLQVPMDDSGMDTDALAELLARLDRDGELPRVKMIYVIDYFQNPSGRTMSLERRQRLVELARKYSKHRTLYILEDAAYRELRYDGDDLPSIKRFDTDNRHVLLTMTFSKPMAPGFKTGYGILPTDLVQPLLRFKGNHDFGSSNLNQYVLDRLLEKGDYYRHVDHLRDVYREKRDAMLAALEAEFPAVTGATWTRPDGGLYVWIRFPDGLETGPDSPLMKAALAEEVLYVPGEFCYVKGPGRVRTEARLSFGVSTPDRIREGIARLARAARSVGLPRVSQPRLAGCRG